MSGEVILMTLLGGIGTSRPGRRRRPRRRRCRTSSPHSDFPVTVLTGIIFVVCVLLFRRGIVGEAVHRLRG